jgi:D-amino peptidase
MVGYHAMNRVANGVLFHSQSPNNDARYFYNDMELGEIGQAAMYYGDFGVPVAMVTGDVAVCREARELLGEGVVTVAVKEGYGRQSARCLAPARAHGLIRAGAREAIGRAAGLTPLRLQTPVRCWLETSAEPVPAEYTAAQLEAVAHVT